MGEWRGNVFLPPAEVLFAVRAKPPVTPCPSCGCVLYREFGKCKGSDDAWMEAAIEELLQGLPAGSPLREHGRARVLAILRKHRDGKA